jgi:hypothetical protein
MQSIFNKPKYRVVLRASNNTELAGTGTARHHLVNVHGVVLSQIIQDKNAMVIRNGHTKLLDLGANMVTEIVKNIDCCANVLQALNPMLMPLYTSTDQWGEPWVPWLNCNKNCNVCTMVIVPIFLHTKTCKAHPPVRLHFSIVIPNLSTSINLCQGTGKTPAGEGSFQKLPTRY